MKRYATYWVVILILLIGICSESYLLLKQSKQYEYVINELTPYSDQKCSLSKNLIDNITYIGREIPSNTMLTDLHGCQHNMRDLCSASERPMLIVRFSDNYCPACVEYSVKIIKELLDEGDKISVVFIGNSAKSSLFRANVEHLNIEDEEVYNCSNLDITLEYNGFPYYLIIDKNATIKCCYLPTKHMESFDKEEIKLLYGKICDYTE